ncbi:MAG: hypothetical protein RBT37_02075 [Dissulfurispiraceae bacterium]|jgi:energy-coupling factor transporter ATP-binding protein EcfA2|nr:hypothetical protein [Dissulfurispiraceae bacterium]
MSNYERGSEWRKWDLHIHTPESICQNYGGPPYWDKFIEALEKLPSEVKVIGITDYYFIDGYEKVMEYRAKGRLANLDKIFPILEFRIDTFGSGNVNKLQKINLHILFDLDESSLKTQIAKVKNEFIEKIPISRLAKHKTKSLSKENLTLEGGNDLHNGFNSFIPPTETIFDLLESSTWKNKVFTFLGYKEWSNLEKCNQLKPLKEDLYNRVGAFFTSNFQTIENSQNWLNEYGGKKVLHSGDIHDFAFLDTANKNDNGEYLKSQKYNCVTWIKADPTFEGLKQIIFEPNERVRIQEANPAKDFEKPYFKSISISGQAIKGGVPSFEKKLLPLNPGLVALIGGRGTGKSILLDCVYKLFKNVGGGDEKLEVTEPKNLKIVFSKSDGTEIDFLYEDSKKGELEYLHVRQGEIKEIALNPEKLSGAIKKLLGIDTSIRVPEYDQEMAGIINRIESSLAWFDFKIVDGPLINNREYNENVIKSNEKLIETISTKQNKENIEMYQKNQQKINKRKSAINKFTNFKTLLASHKLEINRNIEELNNYDLDIESLPSADFTEIEKLVVKNIEKLNSDILNLNEANRKIEGSFREQGINQDISGLLEKITQYQREIDKAKDKIAEYDDKIKTINADVNHRIQLVDKIDKYLNNEIKSINDAFKIIAEGKDGWSEKQKDIVKNLLSNITIEGKIHFNTEVFYKGLSKILNGSKFRATNTESHESRIRNKFNVSTFEDYIKLLKNEKIISNGDDFISLNEFYDQKDYFLKESYNIYQYLYLFSYREVYLNINPIITYMNKSPDKLSVGQRGTFYVCMKLATDPFGSPFIFDQPEDDLDNEFIMKELVPIFKEIKKYRQVIIATHNANLVVNADAEQVIVANNNDEVLSYVSGSIENTNATKALGIKERICNILEGGNQAFIQREKRYGINKKYI